MSMHVCVLVRRFKHTKAKIWLSKAEMIEILVTREGNTIFERIISSFCFTCVPFSNSCKLLQNLRFLNFIYRANRICLKSKYARSLCYVITEFTNSLISLPDQKYAITQSAHTITQQNDVHVRVCFFGGFILCQRPVSIKRS